MGQELPFVVQKIPWMLIEGSQSIQSFFRVRQSKTASQKEKKTCVTNFQEPQLEFPCWRSLGCHWLPPPPTPEDVSREPQLSAYLCSGTSEQPGILSGGAHHPGGNSQGSGGRSKNAGSRCFTSVLSRASQVKGIASQQVSATPSAKKKKLQQVISKALLGSKILGPYGQGNQRQQGGIPQQSP